MARDFPNLTPVDEVTVRVPAGMTEEDFLRRVRSLTKPTSPSGEKYPKCDTCTHWIGTFPVGYCNMYSSSCITSVMEGKMPTWYTPKVGGLKL